MTINFNIPFTKKFFAQKSPLSKFNVCAQIEAIKFQKKNKFDPVSNTFGLNLNFKKCHIFDQMSNFHSGSLSKQVSKIKKETYFEYLLQPSFKISLNFGRRVFTFRDIQVQSWHFVRKIIFKKLNSCILPTLRLENSKN